MNWIDAEKEEPEEGKKLLLKIFFKRFLDGNYYEDEIIMVGMAREGGWILGDTDILWDYDYNIGFNNDDVTAWIYLDDLNN